MKKIGIIIFVTIVIGLTDSFIFAERTNLSELKYVGNYAAQIQAYGELVFDVILKSSFDKKELNKIEPYKPKKVNENPIIAKINNELNEYNLTFGDLFIGKYIIDNENIVAFVLIYGTLKPSIRYYLIKK